jgi:poly-gamma-glutamate capsule biosynthesis protein CapA/YwtB (metallophosphatase superfamily)
MVHNSNKESYLFLLWLLGCTDPALLPCEDTPEQLEGLVVDMAGTPISGASIRVGWSEVTSDADGRFQTPLDPGSRWVHVSAEGFAPRTRSAIPKETVQIRLHSETPGQISMVFGGDVMAARRFQSPDADSEARLEENASAEDIRALLAPISPLFDDAHYRSVNLEGPLLEGGVANPEQENPLNNPTALSQALAQVGINVVNLANNHTNDFLEEGIQSTLQRLNNSELIHLGAGLNHTEAWAGHQAFVDGSPLKMISCALLYEDENAPTDAASEAQAGVAACTVDDLRAAVISARQETDLIVVQIHGGVGYTDSPSYSMQQMVLTAGEAGAAIVVGHGPHVLQGVNKTEGAFAAWSMGNLMYDQNLWATLPTGVMRLVVDSESARVTRATFEPLVIQDYAPIGIRGAVQNNIAREFAARSEIPAVVDDGAVEFDLSGVSWLSQTPDFYESTKGWSLPKDLGGSYVSAPIIKGRARVGRDLLLGLGSFEEVDLGGKCGQPLFWEATDTRTVLHAEAAQAGQFGMRSTVSRYSTDPARSRPQHRIALGSEIAISLSGWIRGEGDPADDAGHVELRFYTDTSSPAFSTHSIQLDTQSEWKEFSMDTFIPEKATHVLPFVGGAARGKNQTVDVDSLALIAWSSDLTTQMARYNYLQVDGRIDFQKIRRLWPGMSDTTVD